MTRWRRAFVPGGTFFFTLVTERREPLLTTPMGRMLLGAVMRECQRHWPFEVLGIVLLPDHLHAILHLPDDDADYPKRWGWVKKEFTKRWLAAGGVEQLRTPSRLRNRRRGVWQRRYWEHCIRDDEDLSQHMDYLHFNPVKHRYVACPADWLWSSIHRYIREGVYTENWGCGGFNAPDIADGEF